MYSPLRIVYVNNPSYVWASISAARKLLLLKIRHKVYSKYEVKVWEDPLIPIIPAIPARPSASSLHPNMRVGDLINKNMKEWSIGLLENYV